MSNDDETTSAPKTAPNRSATRTGRKRLTGMAAVAMFSGAVFLGIRAVSPHPTSGPNKAALDDLQRKAEALPSVDTRTFVRRTLNPDKPPPSGADGKYGNVLVTLANDFPTIGIGMVVAPHSTEVIDGAVPDPTPGRPRTEVASLQLSGGGEGSKVLVEHLDVLMAVVANLAPGTTFVEQDVHLHENHGDVQASGTPMAEIPANQISASSVLLNHVTEQEADLSGLFISRDGLSPKDLQFVGITNSTFQTGGNSAIEIQNGQALKKEGVLRTKVEKAEAFSNESSESRVPGVDYKPNPNVPNVGEALVLERVSLRRG